MEKIYKKDINKVMPILQALVEGKTIQFAINGDSWIDIDSNEEGLFLETLMATPQRYRIKPEPKYRPFEDAEECWNEMQKHQPFGWVKLKDNTYRLISLVDGNRIMLGCQDIEWSYGILFNDFKFADDAPFGIKEEE